MAQQPRIAVIGGGPAGLRAAEVAAAAGPGVTVDLYEAKPSVGRKFLVAGRGGLNLTHGEPLPDFVTRYSGPDQPAGFWVRTIGAFSPTDLRAWAAGLGIETFEQRTGRVYPREMKAAPLLRRWLQRLRESGVSLHMNRRWTGLEIVSHRSGDGSQQTSYRLRFAAPDGRETLVEADAVILALGGASWPVTGSDGCWTAVLAGLGVAVQPLVPANCGWECPWPAEVLAVAEGQPLKNLAVRPGAEGRQVRGELMVTAYGLEGGAIYQLGPELRALEEPILEIDFKPDSSAEELLRRMESVKKDPLIACRARWKLSAAAHAVFSSGVPSTMSVVELAQRLKRTPIVLRQPRPIAEAISSAGGVRWQELDEFLMIRALPGIFVAGEMIDWEAPTGGYLMQGCFASGTLTGAAARRFLCV